MIRRIACAMLALSCIVSPALADWQYTKWGMTVGDVLSASNGQMKPCTPKACEGPSGGALDPKAFGPYSAGEFNFTAFAMFDDRGALAKVYLRLDDPSKYLRLQHALAVKYGAPTREDAGFLKIIYWQPDNDRIEMRRIGETKPQLVSLEYYPRVNASNKGL